MKQLHYLYADFETTNPNRKGLSPKEYYALPNPKYPEVYSWNILYDEEYKDIFKTNKTLIHNTDKKVKYNFGIRGETFLEQIESIQKDTLIFFNNSKAFDAHFIVPILDNTGYENVLPFEIEDLLTLSDKQQKQYLDRALRLKEVVLKNPKVNALYVQLKNTLGIKTANTMLAGNIKRIWNKLLPKEYSLMTNDNNQIYEIKIGIGSNKKTKGLTRNRAVIIRDNMLLFPSAIKKQGETIVKQFMNQYNIFLEKGLVTQKDYDKYHTWCKERYYKKTLKGGYKRSTLYKDIETFKKDKNQFNYLINDTYILYSYHKFIETHFPRSKWKMTIGSTAYNEWRNTLGEEFYKKALENKEFEEITLPRGAKRCVYNNKTYTTATMKEILIKKVLPTSWLDKQHDQEETMHKFLYKWYDGGISHVNEKYRGQLVQALTFLDINSSYPNQMTLDVDVPIGEPVKGDNKKYKFKIYELYVHKKIENKHGLPFLHNVLADKREYVKVLKPNTIYRFTSITLPRFLKYYNPSKDSYTLKVEYSFKTTKMYKLFDTFIKHWYSIKEQADTDGIEILKMVAKLFLNSVYGKNGTKSERDSKIWNQFDSVWEGYSQEVDSNYYLPIAIVITELARMQLVDAVDMNYHDFVYCDTDSIACVNFKPENYKNVNIHKSELGKWDIEFKNMYGIFRRPKQYMLLSADNPKKAKQAFAGINFNRLALADDELEDLELTEEELKDITLLDFIKGKTIAAQLKPYRLLGYGIILEDTKKDIKPIWDYEPLSEQKFYKEEHFLNTIREIKKLKRISVLKN